MPTMNARAQKHAYARVLNDHPADITEEPYFLYTQPKSLENWDAIKVLPVGTSIRKIKKSLEMS